MYMFLKYHGWICLYVYNIMATLPNVILWVFFISQTKKLVSLHQQFSWFLISLFARGNTFEVSPSVIGKAFTKISSCQKLTTMTLRKRPVLKFI